MELLADLQWDEGCTAAFEVESQGYDAFVDLIGGRQRFGAAGEILGRRRSPTR